MNKINKYLDYVKNRTTVKAVISNIAWLSFDKILRLSIGAVVGILATRYLGPERYGTLAYAGSIASLSGAFIGLGLDQIIVRDLSISNKKENELLGTSFILKLSGGVIAYVLSILALFILQSDSTIFTLVSIIGLSLIFRAFDVLQFYFQSQIKAKFLVISRNIAFSITTVLKLFFILFKMNVFFFGLLISLELFIAGLFFIYFYSIQGKSILRWNFNFSTSRILLVESWPLILGSIAATIYFNIDQIFIANLLNNKQVGYYAAALRLSEIWYFIPSAIHISLLPTLTKIANENKEIFYKRFAQVCAYTFSFALVFALTISLSANKLILLIYGKDFSSAGSILAIHAWTLVVIFIGIMASLYTMIFHLQKISLIYNIVIAILNILLDWYLIPHFNAVGAAYATLIAYTIGNYLILFFLPSTKDIAILITKTIINPFIFYKV